MYQEFFLFVKTTEHLTNDHEKVVFLRKQIGYFKCFSLIQKLLSSGKGHAHEAKKIDRGCRENCDKFEDVTLN